MSLSIEDDITTIMQYKGKIVLTPKGENCIREFGNHVEVYSDCLRDLLPTQMSATKICEVVSKTETATHEV